MTSICAMSSAALALQCALLIVSLSSCTTAMRLPRDTSSQLTVAAQEKHAASSALGSPDSPLDEDRRATWLSTRQMEDDFKELVFLAIQELSNEGRIDPTVVRERPMTKRGRWQGFCFQRTSSGRFLPYICWKGDRK